MEETPTNDSEAKRPSLQLIPPHTSEPSQEQGDKKMSAIEADRLDLYQSASVAMGERAASTLMEHLPPLGWGDVARKSDLFIFSKDNMALQGAIIRLEDTMATKSDIAMLETRIEHIENTMATKSDIAMLETRIEHIENTMATNADIAMLETKITEMDKRYDIRFEALEKRMTAVEKSLQLLEAKLNSTTWKLLGLMFSGYGAVIFTIIKHG